MNQYFVYILASKKYGVLYIGITNNLKKRVWEHRNAEIQGFTKKYKIFQLVFFEETSDINSAIAREKQLKKWERQWKIELIDKFNPSWKDLYLTI